MKLRRGGGIFVPLSSRWVDERGSVAVAVAVAGVVHHAGLAGMHVGRRCRHQPTNQPPHRAKNKRKKRNKHQFLYLALIERGVHGDPSRKSMMRC